MDEPQDLLDLLTPEDGGRVRYVEPVGPFICPWCHREERNHFLLQNNHSPDCYRALREHECTAMHLTRNHVSYFAQVLAGTHVPPGCVSSTCKHKTVDPRCAREGLERSLLRVREVWPSERLTWAMTLLAASGLGSDLVDELVVIAA